MKLIRRLEEKLTENITFGISFKGKEAAQVTVREDRMVVEVKNPIAAAEIAVEGYLVARNLKKLKSRIIKASKKMTFKLGPLSFDV